MQQTLGPWLAGHGYKTCRGQRSFWHRPCGRPNALVGVQLGRTAKAPRLGGKLWLNCWSGAAVTKDLQRGETLPPAAVCSKAQLDDWDRAKRAVLDRVLAQPDLARAGEP